jgi:hypothetical protein
VPTCCRRARSASECSDHAARSHGYERNLNVAGAVSRNGAENGEEPLTYEEQRIGKENKMDRKKDKSRENIRRTINHNRMEEKYK